MLGNAAYTASGIGINDTIAGYGYRYIYVPLPREMGYDVFRKFKQDPRCSAIRSVSHQSFSRDFM